MYRAMIMIFVITLQGCNSVDPETSSARNFCPSANLPDSSVMLLVASTPGAIENLELLMAGTTLDGDEVALVNSAMSLLGSNCMDPLVDTACRSTVCTRIDADEEACLAVCDPVTNGQIALDCFRCAAVMIGMELGDNAAATADQFVDGWAESLALIE